MADIKEIAEKIRGAENILVALSKNPSVDEVSAALGLTLMLDKIGKKATAIYSGATPDVLKFLKPEDTFSADTNALQDFIIALDKEKADHLRYKVDGDYVKVFITPYRAAISENDLEYSYGDFNVDLIVALDVANEKDLDGALIEYGRIMHDAGAVNITTHEGGNFSETEWCNPHASSVSEMVGELGAELGDDTLEKNSATALLTGIVASTERFANNKTTPETMGVAAKLMVAGADQKLIVENIERAEVGEEQVMLEEAPKEETAAEATSETEGETPAEATTEAASAETASEPEGEAPETTEELEEKSTATEEPAEEPQKPVLETPSELLAEMPGAEMPKAEEPVQEAKEPETDEPKVEEPEPEVKEPETDEPKVEEPEPEAEEPKAETPKVEIHNAGEASAPSVEDSSRRSVNLQPSAEAQAELEKIVNEEPKKNELLDELNKFTGEQAVSGGLKPDVGLSSIDTDSIGKTEVKDYSKMMAAALESDGGMPNPAVQAAPAVMTGPEVNHIPDIDFSQTTDTAAEQPPVMQNGMLEPVASDKPEGAAQEGMTAAVEPSAAEPGMVPAQEGMNGDILPPPPAPPVDGTMMPPGAEPVSPVMPAMPTVDTAAPEAAPAMPEPTPAAPAMPEPTPAAPAMPEPAPAEPAAIPAMPETPVVPTPTPETQAPTQVGPTPVNDDPTAFRIPGL